MNISEIKELLAGTPTAEQLATLAADERKGVQKLLAAYNKRLEKAAAEKERFTAMLKLESELYAEGCELIAGVDEAGRTFGRTAGYRCRYSAQGCVYQRAERFQAAFRS